MAKKKTITDTSSRIEIKETRPAGKVSKKPNLFGSIQLRHPIEDIFNQRNSDPIPTALLTKPEFPLSPDSEILASQNSNDRLANISSFGNTNAEDLASQNDIIGKPNEEKLAIKQAKQQSWQAKNLDDLAIKQAKNSELASQIERKKKPWGKYNKARSTETAYIRADAGIIKEIKHFNVENNLDMRQFFEMSARHFMDTVGKPTTEKLAIKQAFDDRRLMITWKTRPSIINLYLDYNSIFNKKTKWSVKDDEAASTLNETDLQIIELGIIQTQSNKNYSGKINSFSYYLNEIQNFLELNLPPESINIMLDVNRKKWKQATGK